MYFLWKTCFRIDEHAVRRAGVDYWHLVDVRQEPTFESFAADFAATSAGRAFHLFAATATKSYLDVDFAPGDALVFGKESVGLSEELVAAYPDRLVGIPTIGQVRSLNVANAVSIALYEALRRTGALDGAFTG